MPKYTVDELRSVLRSALVSDVLDTLGHTRQCLGWDIIPITSNATLVGRAFTVTCVPVDGPPEEPYRGLLRALDEIGREEVFTLPTDRANNSAFWGELLSTACMARGAAGALTDGLVRDARRVRQLGFPVFARGTVPYDINGRFEIVGTGEAVAIDRVTVGPGELIVGDPDGVVVIPAELEEEVVARAIEKSTREDLFRKAVASGMKPSTAFAEYKVL